MFPGLLRFFNKRTLAKYLDIIRGLEFQQLPYDLREVDHGAAEFIDQHVPAMLPSYIIVMVWWFYFRVRYHSCP